ncbi:MAG TPA: CDGSH iron-sulfur domain-containing protein [Actinopolymorphaceae bacterium]
MAIDPAERRPAASHDERRIVVVPGGPLLIDGPLTLLLDDSSTVRSERFVVALCACGRSRRFPFCDTSHRRRVRQERS